MIESEVRKLLRQIKEQNSQSVFRDFYNIRSALPYDLLVCKKGRMVAGNCTRCISETLETT